MNKYTILIDAGHGKDTPGKCSPDGKLYEWEWTRKCASKLEILLKDKGFNVERVYPEVYEDFKSGKYISNRVNKVNKYCMSHPNEDIILVSIHINAAGSDSKWHSASGFSVFVGPYSSSKSKKLARCIYTEADKTGLKGNRSVPACKYWTGNFGVLTRTACPAVLTENLFMDNQSDVEILKPDSGLDKLVKAHLDGIISYFNG